jgi:multiple antibiotic resistance protein
LPAFLSDFSYEFVTLLVILDPIGGIPLFLVAAGGLDRRRSILVAFHALLISFLVLLFFIVSGQFLLEALKIPMPSFQLAGSLVLLLFGLQMVLGKLNEAMANIPPEMSLLDRAVYPLAMPTIAGPGAILTVVLLTDNRARTIEEQVITTGVLALCLAVMFITFTSATLIFRFLGKAGIEVVTRVFGLIVASIAVTGLIESVKASFRLT